MIKTFDEDEIKSFRKFINSPYFKRERDLNKYFNFLMKYYPDFNISKNILIKKFCGEVTEKNSKLINTLNADLRKTIEDFFAVEFIFNNDYYYAYSLMSKLSFNGLYPNVEKTIDQYKKKNTGMYEDQNLYYQLYMLDTILHSAQAMQGNFNNILKLMISQSENVSKFFIVLSNYFLNSFAVRDLKQVYPDKTLLINLILNNINFDKLLHEFKNYEGDFKIKLNLYIMALFSGAKDKDKFIVPLIHTYKENYEKLNIGDKIIFFTLINNFISGKTRDKYINEMFDLIKFVTDKKMLLSSGFQHYNIQNFKTSLLIALRIKKIKWAKKYFKDHINHLPEDVRYSAGKYAESFLLNAEGHYEKSNEKLLKVKIDNEFMIYDIRTLQLKNYYELALKDSAYLENLIYGYNALNNFLRTNRKVSHRIIESGIDFKKGVSILIKFLKADKKPADDIIFGLKKVYGQIRNYWVKEKIEEILNNY
ncbi:MAG TPA: hypothetical protein PLG90_02805 [Ignavibacteria bacterium]|nr:hypothetical protein [Ignavibacteria bacterium]